MIERLAVSNIAWEPDEDEAIATLMRREGVRGVELAPTKWRPDPFAASASDVRALRRWWEDRGIRVVSLQALLFGRPELQLFTADAVRAELADYLRSAMDFAAEVGAKALVFGSPKNRARGPLSMREATDIAVPFFSSLGDHAVERGVTFCLEANPPAYGCDFLTTTSEAVALCRAIDHPGIRVNGDLGGMTMNGEDVAAAIREASDVLGHFHISEPNLGEIAEGAGSALRALEDAGFGGWASIETRALGQGRNVAAVERAILCVARRATGDEREKRSSSAEGGGSALG